MPAFQLPPNTAGLPPRSAESCVPSRWRVDVVSADEAVRDSLSWRLAGQGLNCRALADLDADPVAEEGSERCVLLDPGVEPGWLMRQVTALADTDQAPRLVLVLEPALDELLRLLASCRMPLHGLPLPFSFERFEAILATANQTIAGDAPLKAVTDDVSMPVFV